MIACPTAVVCSRDLGRAIDGDPGRAPGLMEQRARLSIGWHGPPTSGIAVLLIGHRLWVADELDGQAPRRPRVDKPIALPGLRSRQRVGAGHEVHPMAAHMLRSSV